jgi:hypothetical protein
MANGSIVAALAGRKVIIQLPVEPLACPCGHLKGSSVTDELHYVPRAIQDGAAVSTVLEVGGHSGAESGVDDVVKIA